VPLPVNACAVGEFAASLENESVAEAVPDVAGLNVTAKEVFWPAARVVGKEIPESSNSLLLMLAAEMVTDAPLASRVPFSEPLAPTTTLPKSKLAGETDSWPCAVPVPESAMLSGELSAVDTTERLPLLDPVAVGAKVIVNVTLCFGERVIGTLSPLTAKPAPLMSAAEMVTFDPPVLVKVSESLALLLFCTLPKESVDDDAASVEPPLEPAGARL
jgi:hypothetical protein